MPVTTPVVVFTIAVATSAVLQVPPAVALVRFVVEPSHTVRVPVIGVVAADTVTATVAVAIPQVLDLL
jgi:hypothetical protein